MSPLLVSLVLTAAVLHAVWNAMAKSGGKPEISIASYQLVGALVCLPMLWFVPAPEPAAWPMIIASVIIHNFYYFSLARAYRVADLSQVYPLFRGLSPVLVATAAALVAGEWLSPGTFAGIAVVSVGVISLAFRPGSLGLLTPAALFWGLTTSVLIGTYTVVDGLGVRAAGHELSYIFWLFTFEVVPIAIILLLTRPREWALHLRANWGIAVLGGVASSAAYGLVIFAMSLGAMAVVSSLRETSVIFAAVIGALFLREPFGPARIRAAMIVALGVILMRLFG